MRDARLARLTSVLALMVGCGPAVSASGGSGSASAGSSGASTTTSASTSAPASSSGGESSGTAITCPDNVANEPFCYRKVPIDWDGGVRSWWGKKSARVGNFGPAGEEAYLLAGLHAGEPMGLAFWDGQGFDVRPWGVVPELDDSFALVPARMFDGVHADLVVGTPIFPSVGVAPWGPAAPGEPLVVEEPMPDYILDSLSQQPVIDVDGDGREEFPVSVLDASHHQLVRNIGGVPTLWGPANLDEGFCGGSVDNLTAGDLDSDGNVDLAMIGPCDFRLLGGEFSFAIQWGDGAGGFTTTSFPFQASNDAAWLEVADVDGDGVQDVVYASKGGESIHQSYLEFHRSRGDRTFDPPVRFWTNDDPGGYPAGGSASAFILGDVDGDGTQDVMFRLSMIAITHVADVPQFTQMFEIEWDHVDTNVVSAFDLNHDGRLDFIVHDEVEGVYALMSAE